MTEEESRMDIRKLAEEIEPEIYDVFCRLHRNPELSMREFETSALLERELREKTGADIVRRVGKTGLLAEVRGKKPGLAHHIGLRADMDALPITEDPSFSLRSDREGVMHACGHDAHASILLGAARILDRCRGFFSGTVTFLFQPGEETLEGAKSFLEDETVDLSHLEGVAACHVLPDLEAGEVGIRRGPVLAGSNGLTITIRGKQGHASKPNEAVDPITPAAAIIPALQELTAKELHPADPAVITIHSIHCGDEAVKVVPAELRMAGSVKCLSPVTRAHLLRRIPEICRGIAESMRCSADVEITDGPPPLINDEAWADRAERVCIRLMGKEKVKSIPLPSMCSEDFSYFMENTKGVFVRIGSREPGGPYGATHNPSFRADRKVLTVGMLTMAGLALDFFGAEYA